MQEENRCNIPRMIRGRKIEAKKGLKEQKIQDVLKTRGKNNYKITTHKATSLKFV